MEIDQTPEAPAEAPSNVIGINPDCELELQRVKKPPAWDAHGCYGIHKQIVVDEQYRTVFCEKCNRTIDAFEYLMQWAKEGDRRMSAFDLLGKKTKIAATELRILEARIDSVRGKLKREGFPQPQVERNAYRSAMLNAEWAKPQQA